VSHNIDLDLLPFALQRRVLRARASRRATRTALGLVLIGALAGAAAEAARNDAFVRMVDARVAAAGTTAASEARARVEAMVDARSKTVRQTMSDRERVPLTALLAALAEPLPDAAHVASARFTEKDQTLVVDAVVAGMDANELANAIRARAPSFTITVLDGTTLRLVVPRDRPFTLTAQGGGPDDGR
jgi:hypothetical protein